MQPVPQSENHNHAQYRKPLCVVFFGVSGAGKGTQAELLTSYLSTHDAARKAVHIEMGALLRAFTDGPTALGTRSKQVMERGELLPTFVPIYVLSTFIDKALSGNEHLIIDGVARKAGQAKMLVEMLDFYGYADRHVVTLELSREVAKERLHARGRSDDATDEAIEKRFAWYEENVRAAIAVFSDAGYIINSIDGSPSVEAIHSEILNTLALPLL
jgi:adenylate kinase family enzyme